MTMDASRFLSDLSCPLIPVVVIDRLDDAVPVAEALLGGGIAAIEVTLRTAVGRCVAAASAKVAHPGALRLRPQRTAAAHPHVLTHRGD